MILSFYTASVLIPVLILIFLVVRIIKNRVTEIMLCLECERCMGVCPLLMKEGNNFPGPVHIMLQAKVSAKPEMFNNDLLLCTKCGLCSRVCPRGLEPYKVLDILKKNNGV
ncbi:MAG TPA: 4Fe-4S dicluster domain-containing protein [Spirochaetota bacterium]|nr:4Fe-4S dicluster domain-containing protein [Spirochaetota bacterium]HPS85856.1 4Fe-4S dicluster domain-containing protein [Spirochaetota bacterium]